MKYLTAEKLKDGWLIEETRTMVVSNYSDALKYIKHKRD